MEKLLPEVCDIQYGYAFDSSLFSTTEGTPLIRIRDVLRGYSETYTTEECPEQYVINNGDILIGMDGEFNIARWKGGKAYLNQRVCKLTPKEGITSDYLFYFMPKALKEIEAKTPFVTVKHLSAKQLNAVRVPVPTFEEQRHIGEILNRIILLIGKRTKQLEKLDQLVKSQFIEMFGKGFPTVTALSVCDAIVDCPHATPKYLGDELIYPAIRTSEICNGQIEWSSMKYVDKNEYNERTKRLVPEPGDIIYAREGTYGDCVIIPEGKRFCLGQRTMLFRPNYSLCTSEYLHQVLRSENVKRQADESNAGSTVPHVNVADAKAFKIQLPPIELQNKFAAFIRQADKSKFAIRQSLEQLETLKKSLMQEYFG